MDINFESFLPFALIGLIGFTVFYNTSTPNTTPNGYTIIKPKIEFELIRGFSDIPEEDNKIIIRHLEKPEDTLELRLWKNYLLLPKDKDGNDVGIIKINDDGSERSIWEITHIRKKYGVELNWDIGAYGGYLMGNKDGTNITDYDVGIRFSPIRFFNTIALDGLISPQAAGIGLSIYPAPERFGEFWDSIGLGYAQMMTYEDDTRRSMFYLSISTRF
jgi:hypothetical protein